MIVDDTNEQLQHVGTLKYINLFTTHADTHIQRIGYINRVHKHKCLPFLFFLSLVFLQIERVCNWILGETVLKVYLPFFDGFLWKIFPLLRANRLYF